MGIVEDRRARQRRPEWWHRVVAEYTQLVTLGDFRYDGEHVCFAIGTLLNTLTTLRDVHSILA